jgi:hypothetical protein
MRDVFKINVSKTRIMAMPARERAMFLLLGYAANQVALYTKLAILSTNYRTTDEVESTLSAAQSLMIMRTVAGILHETWSGVITKHFLNSPEGRKYLDAMDAGGKASLDALKRLFGKSGFLASIRNDFAFHYPKAEDMEAACQLAAADPSSDSEWHWYFARSGWNSFYFLSEIMVMHGVLQTAGAADLVKAQERLRDDMRVANNKMVTLLQALIAAMWTLNIGGDFEAIVVARIDGAPKLFEFALPYFFDASEGPLPDP